MFLLAKFPIVKIETTSSFMSMTGERKTKQFLLQKQRLLDGPENLMGISHQMPWIFFRSFLRFHTRNFGRIFLVRCEISLSVCELLANCPVCASAPFVGAASIAIESPQCPVSRLQPRKSMNNSTQLWWLVGCWFWWLTILNTIDPSISFEVSLGCLFLFGLRRIGKFAAIPKVLLLLAVVGFLPAQSSFCSIEMPTVKRLFTISCCFTIIHIKLDSHLWPAFVPKQIHLDHSDSFLNTSVVFNFFSIS